MLLRGWGCRQGWLLLMLQQPAIVAIVARQHCQGPAVVVCQLLQLNLLSFAERSFLHPTMNHDGTAIQAGHAYLCRCLALYFQFLLQGLQRTPHFQTMPLGSRSKPF